MSGAKHTAGPWEVVHNGHGSFDIWGAYDDSGKQAILTSRGRWLHNAEQSEANARLIAAAPDLLAACNDAFDFLGGVDGAAEIRGKLLAAIARATGEA